MVVVVAVLHNPLLVLPHLRVLQTVRKREGQGLRISEGKSGLSKSYGHSVGKALASRHFSIFGSISGNVSSFAIVKSLEKKPRSVENASCCKTLACDLPRTVTSRGLRFSHLPHHKP